MPTYEYKCKCGACQIIRDQPVTAETIKCTCGEMAKRVPFNYVPVKPCKGMYSFYLQNRGKGLN